VRAPTSRGVCAECSSDRCGEVGRYAGWFGSPLVGWCVCKCGVAGQMSRWQNMYSMNYLIRHGGTQVPNMADVTRRHACVLLWQLSDAATEDVNSAVLH
jgi:hypothetical protein